MPTAGAWLDPMALAPVLVTSRGMPIRVAIAAGERRILGVAPNRCSRAVLTVRWTHSTFTRVSEPLRQPNGYALTPDISPRTGDPVFRAAGRGRHYRS